jgi:hypothetical protein
MSITTKFTAALVLIVSLIASHWYTYEAGNRNGANAVLVKQQEADLQAWIDSATEMSVEIDRQHSVNQRVSHEYHQETTAVYGYKPADRRLRISAKVCSKVAGETKTTSAARTDGGAAGTVALPEDLESRLWGRRKEADGIVAICRGLQNWARANGFYRSAGSESSGPKVGGENGAAGTILW